MVKCKNCVVGLLGACAIDYCRQEREALIEQAWQSAEQRGHTLTEFVKVRHYPIWEAQCARCSQRAAINLDPLPNEADIYGEAVNVNCPEMDDEQSGARADEEMS